VSTVEICDKVIILLGFWFSVKVAITTIESTGRA
jgi:hypothetical protein